MAPRLAVASTVVLVVAGRCLASVAIKTGRSQRPFAEERPRFGQAEAGSSDALAATAAFCDKGGYARHGAHTGPASRDCAPCWLSEAAAPRLFIWETTDGFGARLTNLIYAMALAAYHGMNLGGVQSAPGIGCINDKGTSHGIHLLTGMKFVLGLQDPGELFIRKMPEVNMSFHGMREFFGNETELHNNGENYFLDPKGGSVANDLDNYAYSHSKGNVTKISEYVTPAFLKALRRPDTPLQQFHLTHFSGAPAQKNIAVHVRRGDVSAKQVDRHTPDDWYYDVVERIRNVLPDGDVHVYSTLEGKHDDSEFDGYRERNMTVHLDGSIEEDLAHMARADVLVTAKSSFSQVAALLNENCVVYQGWWLRPLEGMITVADGIKARKEWGFDEKALTKCIARLGERPESTEGTDM